LLLGHPGATERTIVGFHTNLPTDNSAELTNAEAALPPALRPSAAKRTYQAISSKALTVNRRKENHPTCLPPQKMLFVAQELTLDPNQFWIEPV
jgi:hypothetical protein